MNDVNECKLERRIHQELRDLPSLKAPKSLGPRVLAAIAAREAAPWFRKTWADWPLAMKAVFFILGTAALGGLIAAGSTAPELGSFASGFSEWVSAQFAGLKPYYSLLARFTGALGVTIEAAGPNLMWYLAALIAVAYGTCVALGTLGYRLVLNRI